MTTRKEKQEQEAMANLFVWSILALFGLLGLVLLPFTGIFAYFQWRKIKSKLFRPNMIRIHEGSFNTLKLMAIDSLGAVAWIFLTAIGAFIFLVAFIDEWPTWASWVHFLVYAVFALSTIYGLFFYYSKSKQIACRVAGVVILPDEDIMAIPCDSLNNTISDDLVKFKWIKDYCSLEVINIKSIESISREKGKILFIHGEFGTRKIEYMTKQKRDECLYAIQRIKKQKITATEFE